MVSTSITTLLEGAREAARGAAIHLCWEQWQVVGALTNSSSKLRSTIVDPEALVLASLALQPAERRLTDILVWWARRGATLLSVQRTVNLARRFPDALAGEFQRFARTAAEGGDRRWSGHAKQADALEGRDGKGALTVALHPAAALLLRLRAGMGVGARADLVALLLGRAPDWVTPREAAGALAYTEVAVRNAAQEMARAGFIAERTHGTAGYAAVPDRWAELLKCDESPPRWGYWAEVLAYLVAIADWADIGLRTGTTPNRAASKARDLIDVHKASLDALRQPLPDLASHPGEAFLEPFVAHVSDFATWAMARG